MGEDLAASALLIGCDSTSSVLSATSSVSRREGGVVLSRGRCTSAKEAPTLAMRHVTEDVNRHGSPPVSVSRQMQHYATLDRTFLEIPFIYFPLCYPLALVSLSQLLTASHVPREKGIICCHSQATDTGPRVKGIVYHQLTIRALSLSLEGLLTPVAFPEAWEVQTTLDLGPISPLGGHALHVFYCVVAWYISIIKLKDPLRHKVSTHYTSHSRDWLRRA